MLGRRPLRDRSAGPRLPRWLGTGLLLVLAFSLGVAVSAGRPGLPRPTTEPASSSGVPPLAPTPTPPPIPAPAPTPAPGGGASPEQALAEFLSAEAAGDHEASYALLSATDREHYRTPARWVAAHAQLPPITGFELDAAQAGAGSVTLPALLRLRSGLDPVLGLVPARATVAWTAVEEQGGWRVRFGDSDYQPRYPSDLDAPAAARAWAEAVRGGAPARRHDGGALLGVPALGERLRGAAGSVEVGGAGALPASGDAAALLAAFGPETTGWARVVPLRSPVAMDLVLAPVADAWTVVGVLRPGGER